MYFFLTFKGFSWVEQPEEAEEKKHERCYG